MIKDLIIIDNVFENPDEIVSLSKKQKYYYKDNHPSLELPEAKLNNYKLHYAGIRTEPLNFINQDLFLNLNKQILNKVFSRCFTEKVSYKYLSQIFFHLITKDDVKNSSLHIDPHVKYAGVVYLNKNPNKNLGTILKKDNGEEMTVENKYNRLVFYNANILHGPQLEFENQESRLTAVLFYKEISYSKVE